MISQFTESFNFVFTFLSSAYRVRRSHDLQTQAPLLQRLQFARLSGARKSIYYAGLLMLHAISAQGRSSRITAVRCTARFFLSLFLFSFSPLHYARVNFPSLSMNYLFIDLSPSKHCYCRDTTAREIQSPKRYICCLCVACNRNT